MYGKGKLPPPPPRHPSQFGPPAPPGAPGPPNPPYPPPYSFPRAAQSYAPRPPQQTAPHSFTYRTPPPPPVPVMVLPPSAPPVPVPALPPPPSAPPPPVPPPPPPPGHPVPPPVRMAPVPPPKPSEEKVVPIELKDANLERESEIEREREREAVVGSPSLSDMDMEDDDEVPPPDYKNPSSENLHGSQSEAKPSSLFMEDVSPVRLTSSPGPTECIINEYNNNTNKSSDEYLNPNPNLSPFGLIQQGYASDDNDDDGRAGPASDKENNYDDQKEKLRGKRARSKSPSLGLEERNPKLKRESPPSSTPSSKPTVSNQQLPPPPPPPSLPPPPAQITNLPSLHYPSVPVPPPPPPYQSHSLTFPSHSERWPRPSPLPPYPTTSTNYSTITTRYNPYASTFESVPPFSNFSTEYQQPVSGKPYDPLSDSIEPVTNKPDPVPTPVPDPVPDTVSGTVKSTEDLEEVAAPDTEPGIVENSSPDPNTNTGTNTNTVKKESRSLKLLKTTLAEYVKEVLKPAWRQGNITKDVFKLIVKKTVEKVAGSVPEGRVPGTQEKVEKYVLAAQHKVTKLVMTVEKVAGSVEKYVLAAQHKVTKLVMGYVDKYAKS